jgi:ABC-type Fe3+/spermidine/putrescine transport system ATPase subunit
MSTIEIRKVTKQFGAFTAVKDADLKVEAGEVVCLLGPSGCGKSTLARALLAHGRPGSRFAAGRVELGGVDILALPSKQRTLLRGRRVGGRQDFCV